MSNNNLSIKSIYFPILEKLYKEHTNDKEVTHTELDNLRANILNGTIIIKKKKAQVYEIGINDWLVYFDNAPAPAPATKKPAPATKKPAPAHRIDLTNYPQIHKDLEFNYGEAILSTLLNTSHPLKNGKVTRLFDTSKNSSEAFYAPKNDKPCQIFDFKNAKNWFPILAYRHAYNLELREAIIQLGKQYNLIPYEYEPQIKHSKEYVKPKIEIDNTDYTKNASTSTIQKLEHTEFTGLYLDYYTNLGISLDYLQKAKIKPLKSFYIGTQKINVEFGYSFEIAKDVFKIYQPKNKKYKWSWCIGENTEKPKEVVYFLEHLPKKSEIILIVEGLKDCLVLNSNFNEFGIYAVGLDSAKVTISENTIKTLKNKSKNKNVVLCLDNDLAGKEANELQARNTGFNVLSYLPTFKSKDIADLIKEVPKNDILTWFNTSFEKNTQTHTEKKNVPKNAQKEPKKEYSNSKETNNDFLQAFIDGEGALALHLETKFDNIFYNVDTQKFVEYKQGIFNETSQQEVQKSLFQYVVKEYKSSKNFEHKSLVKINSYKYQSAVTKLFQRNIVKNENFDNNDNYLNLLNGFLDLQTLELKEHTNKVLFTKQSKLNYDKASTCQYWNDFINTTFQNDTLKIKYVQKLLGLCLTGLNTQNIFFFYGAGSNGKSTLLETISSILGTYSKTSQNLFTSSKDSSEVLCVIENKRLVTIGEWKQQSIMNIEIAKKVCGDDTIEVRPLYSNSYDIKSKAKYILYGNTMPDLSSFDGGIERRLVMIGFHSKIEKHKVIDNLKDKFNKPAVLNWLLQGLAMYKSEGLHIPAGSSIDLETNEFLKNAKENTISDLENIILDNFEPSFESEPASEFVTTTKIFQFLYNLKIYTNTKNIGITLKKLGFIKKAKRKEHTTIYGYYLKTKA